MILQVRAETHISDTAPNPKQHVFEMDVEPIGFMGLVYLPIHEWLMFLS